MTSVLPSAANQVVEITKYCMSRAISHPWIRRDTQKRPHFFQAFRRNTPEHVVSKGHRKYIVKMQTDL